MHHITRTKDGQYRLGSASFPSLAAAAAFVSEHNIRLAENEYTFAYRLGELIGAYAKSSVDFDQVLVALDEITDPEWWRSAGEFATDLAGFAKVMSE
jgi:hypothetical protein